MKLNFLSIQCPVEGTKLTGNGEARSLTIAHPQTQRYFYRLRVRLGGGITGGKRSR